MHQHLSVSIPVDRPCTVHDDVTYIFVYNWITHSHAHADEYRV